MIKKQDEKLSESDSRLKNEELIWKMWAKGKSPREIAGSLKIPVSIVYQKLKELQRAIVKELE